MRPDHPGTKNREFSTRMGNSLFFFFVHVSPTYRIIIIDCFLLMWYNNVKGDKPLYFCSLLTLSIFYKYAQIRRMK